MKENPVNRHLNVEELKAAGLTLEQIAERAFDAGVRWARRRSEEAIMLVDSRLRAVDDHDGITLQSPNAEGEWIDLVTPFPLDYETNLAAASPSVIHLRDDDVKFRGDIIFGGTDSLVIVEGLEISEVFVHPSDVLAPLAIERTRERFAPEPDGTITLIKDVLRVCARVGSLEFQTYVDRTKRWDFVTGLSTPKEVSDVSRMTPFSTRLGYDNPLTLVLGKNPLGAHVYDSENDAVALLIPDEALAPVIEASR